MRITLTSPSFFFAFHIISTYYPESNTIQSVSDVKRGYRITVATMEGTKLPYSKLSTIQDPNLRWKAYIIDYIMRLSGQGGSNVIIHQGNCYTNWTRERAEPDKEIAMAKYNPMILGMLSTKFGDLNEVFIDISVIYDVELPDVESRLRSLWSY